MTELEWVTVEDPHRALLFIREQASQRQMRLAACAFTSRVRGLFRDPDVKRSFEIVEALRKDAAPIPSGRTPGESPKPPRRVLTSLEVRRLRNSNDAPHLQSFGQLLATQTRRHEVHRIWQYRPSSGV
jgi:hypothetical protein